MNWYKSENIGIKPSELDIESSKVYNYIRKDFEYHPTEEHEDEMHSLPERWTYLEAKIKKEDWELFMAVSGHTAEISDVEDALMELAEIITEG